MLVVVLKGLLAGIIVGFVTGSIRSWVDRFFLVLLLVGMLGLPIDRAIVVNLLVVGMAAMLMTVRQCEVYRAVGTKWPLVVLPAITGGFLGRIVGLATAPEILLGTLGVYAVLVGLRLVLVRPVPENQVKAHPAWLVPVALIAGGLAGFLSAGAKPFKVPIYNRVLGHHPQQAYALSAMGVTFAVWGALLGQLALGPMMGGSDLFLALYEFVVITATGLAVNRLWTEKLNRVVAMVVSPLLILVGIKFMLMAWR